MGNNAAKTDLSKRKQKLQEKRQTTMFKPRIKLIHQDKATAIIQTMKPCGLFIMKEGDSWVGIDNSTGDAWTEDFDTFGKCVRWLAEITRKHSLQKYVLVLPGNVKQEEEYEEY